MANPWNLYQSNTYELEGEQRGWIRLWCWPSKPNQSSEPWPNLWHGRNLLRSVPMPWGLHQLIHGSFTGYKSINCSALVPGLGVDALNYPNMQLSLKNRQEPTVGVFRNTVTNFGPPQSIYNANVRAPKGVEITVKPMRFFFSRASQKRLKVVVKANPAASMEVRSGLLVWKSSKYVLRSPIVVYNPED